MPPSQTPSQRRISLLAQMNRANFPTSEPTVFFLSSSLPSAQILLHSFHSHYTVVEVRVINHSTMSSYYITHQVPAFEAYSAASFVLGLLTVGGTAAAAWATFRLSAGGDPPRSYIKWLKTSMALYLMYV